MLCGSERRPLSKIIPSSTVPPSTVPPSTDPSSTVPISNYHSFTDIQISSKSQIVPFSPRPFSPRPFLSMDRFESGETVTVRKE